MSDRKRSCCFSVRIDRSSSLSGVGDTRRDTLCVRYNVGIHTLRAKHKGAVWRAFAGNGRSGLPVTAPRYWAAGAERRIAVEGPRKEEREREGGGGGGGGGGCTELDLQCKRVTGVQRVREEGAGGRIGSSQTRRRSPWAPEARGSRKEEGRRNGGASDVGASSFSLRFGRLRTEN